MTIQVESDLKDILLKFDQKLDRLQTDMNDVKISVAELKKDNQRLEEKIDNNYQSLNTKIDSTAQRLEEKIDSTSQRLEAKIDSSSKNLTDNLQNLGKRVDNAEFINRGIFVGLILTILGGFAKFLGLIR